MRAYSVEVLRELGYWVLEAHNAPSVLRLLERREVGVDLITKPFRYADLAAKVRDVLDSA